jgi:hypothetical protein
MDRQWCRDATTARALRTYADLRARDFAASHKLQVRVLAAR